MSENRFLSCGRQQVSGRRIGPAGAPGGRSTGRFPCVAILAASILVTPLLTRGAAPIPQSTKAQLEALFDQAQQAAHQHDYDRAEQLYQQILRQDPTLLAARVNLGLAYYWQGNKHEALNQFTAALKQDPHQYSALMFSGLIDLEEGLYDAAAGKLDAAYKIKEDDPLLLWAIGSLAMIHGKAETAIPYLQRSFKLDSRNPRVVWLLGDAYAQVAYRQKNASDVAAHYQQMADEGVEWMAKHYPDSPLLHVFRGDVYAARKASIPALKEYRIALKMDPTWPDLHLLIGSIEEVLDNWDSAQGELQLQLVQHPGDPRALVELGVVYVRTGRNQEAVDALERAIERDRQSYKAEFRLGQAYLNLRKYPLAARHLERATQLDSQESQPYYLLYRAYRALKENTKAAQALKQFNRRHATSDNG